MRCLRRVTMGVFLLIFCLKFDRTNFGISEEELQDGSYRNNKMRQCSRYGDGSSFRNTVLQIQNGGYGSSENLRDHMANKVTYGPSWSPKVRIHKISSNEAKGQTENIYTSYGPTFFVRFLGGQPKCHRCNKHGNQVNPAKQRHVSRGNRKRTKRPLSVLRSQTYGAETLASFSITGSKADIAVPRLRQRKGRDGVLRKPLSRTVQRQIPFCNVAHLKSLLTCSGTVITPNHVLTAAHCVHNGAQFDANLNRMRVTVRSNDGFESRHVQDVHVPRSWTYRSDENDHSMRRSDSVRAVHDYAIVVLDRALPNISTCPRNGTIHFRSNASLVYNNLQTNVRGKRVSFANFPASEKRKLWQTSCRTLDQSAAGIRDGLLATSCPSLKGSSGSAVFAQTSSAVAAALESSLGVFIGVISHEARVAGIRSHMVVTVMDHSKRQMVSAMIDEERNNSPDVKQERNDFLSHSLRRTHA